MTSVAQAGPVQGRSLAGRTSTFLVVILVVAVLYVGRDILMPLGLALLVSYVLGRPVALLEKRGVGRPWAVGLVAGVLMILLGASGWMAWQQLRGVLDELPSHSIAIKEKVGALVRRVAAVQAAGEALVHEEPGSSPTDAAPAKAAPVAGGVSSLRSPPASPDDVGPSLLRQMPAALGWVIGPVGTGSMIMLFAVFMLLHREDLRNRLLRLIGNEDLTGTTLAVTDASQRIGRYLGMQVLINGASGVAAAIALLLLGIPGWALWGCLYALLRFLPYVGPILGVAMPVATALAVSPGWSLFFATLAVLLVMEVIINLLVEPWLYGGSTGVSSFAVLVAAAFWTWLWGPIGLLLAMPLTVVVVVLGKSVRQLGFLHVLFGVDEVLSPGDRYYQRAIANDLDEALRILEEVAAKGALGDAYEELLVPGLVAAERDRQAGKLTEEGYAVACENIRDSLDEMEGRRVAVEARATANDQAVLDCHVGAGNDVPVGVLCLPVKGVANDVAAAVLVRLLGRSGHASRALPVDMTSGERLSQIGDTETVCIVTLPDPTFRPVRAMCRRLRELRPAAKIIVMVWGANVDTSAWRYRSLEDHADVVATKVSDVLLALARERVAVA